MLGDTDSDKLGDEESMFAKISAHMAALGCSDDSHMLVRHLSSDVRSILQRAITSVLGRLGPPDVHSLPHDVLPLRPGEFLCINHQLPMKLYSLVTCSCCD